MGNPIQIYASGDGSPRIRIRYEGPAPRPVDVTPGGQVVPHDGRHAVVADYLKRVEAQAGEPAPAEAGGGFDHDRHNALMRHAHACAAHFLHTGHPSSLAHPARGISHMAILQELGKLHGPPFPQPAPKAPEPPKPGSARAGKGPDTSKIGYAEGGSVGEELEIPRRVTKGEIRALVADSPRMPIQKPGLPQVAGPVNRERQVGGDPYMLKGVRDEKVKAASRIPIQKPGLPKVGRPSKVEYAEGLDSKGRDIGRRRDELMKKNVTSLRGLDPAVDREQAKIGLDQARRNAANPTPKGRRGGDMIGDLTGFNYAEDPGLPVDEGGLGGLPSHLQRPMREQRIAAARKMPIRQPAPYGGLTRRHLDAYARANRLTSPWQGHPRAGNPEFLAAPATRGDLARMTSGHGLKGLWDGEPDANKVTSLAKPLLSAELFAHAHRNGFNPIKYAEGSAGSAPAVKKYARDGEPRVVRYAVRHAPKGGIVIAGKRFVGGEFVPGEWVARATAQQKSMLVAPRGKGLGDLAGGNRPAPAPGKRPAAANVLGVSSRASVRPGFTKGVVEAKKAAGGPRDSGSARGVGFVSPETGEGLSLDEALARMRGDGQAHFGRICADIDRKLGRRTRIESGVGAWAPDGQPAGAEPTTISTYFSARDLDDIKYSVACKGYAGNQIAAIAHGVDPDGPDVLWSMHVAGELSGIHEELKKNGIAYHTIRPGSSPGAKHEILVVDKGGALAENVRKVAEHFGTEAAYRHGHTEFLGDDGGDRKAARRKFRREMRLYAKRHPDRPTWP